MKIQLAMSAKAKDNSFGLGNYKNTYAIKQFVTCTGMPDFKYYPDQEMSLYTFVADTHFSIAEGDMKTLVKAGLQQIKVNENGFITLYLHRKAELA